MAENCLFVTAWLLWLSWHCILKSQHGLEVVERLPRLSLGHNASLTGQRASGIYFSLGLGLVHNRRGDLAGVEEWHRKAVTKGPIGGRSDPCRLTDESANFSTGCANL